jgi:Xaa-Pro aminopeptidase
MSDRAERLSMLLGEAGVDLLLVTDLVNVRYLTGYTGSNGLVLIGAGTRTFVTDFRYRQQVAEEVESSFERHEAPRDLVKAIAERLPGGPLRLGFEDGHMSVRDFRRLREQLPEPIELVPVDGLPERLRAVKGPEEVARVREAAALADAAFDRVVAQGLAGRTERDLALALEVEMRRAGAQRPSFETIVAAGPHGALPHASPRDVEIPRGELVVIDWGAELDGYCSDCTRTVATGEPGDRAREVYAVVLEA